MTSCGIASSNATLLGPRHWSDTFQGWLHIQKHLQNLSFTLSPHVSAYDNVVDSVTLNVISEFAHSISGEQTLSLLFNLFFTRTSESNVTIQGSQKSQVEVISNVLTLPGAQLPPLEPGRVFRELETLKTCAPDCHGTGIVKSCFAFLLGVAALGDGFPRIFNVSSVHFPPNLYIRRIQESQFGPFPTFQGLPLQKMAARKELLSHPIPHASHALNTAWSFPKNLKNTLKILAKLHCAKGKIVNQRRDVSLSWEKTCQLSIAEFIVRWPGWVFMMPVKIHFFRVSIWTWMWKKHFSIFSESTCLNVQRNFVQHFSTTWSTNKRVPHIRIEVQTRNFKQSALPLIRKLPSRSISPSQTPRKTLPRAVEVSVLPWNWVNWAKVR